MGEYTGRRRGRAASEPPAQQPEYPYAEEPSHQQGYFGDDSYREQSYQDPYAQPQPEGQGYEYGYEQPAPGYPAAEYQGYESGYAQQGYEAQAQPQYGYEAAPGYEQAQYAQAPNPGYEYAPEYAQDPAYGYQDAPSYEQYPSYDQQPGYEQQQPGYEQQGYAYPTQEYQADYNEGYGYPEPYQQEGYPQEGYQEGYRQEPYYEESYAEPTQQPRRRGHSAPVAESYADAEPYADGYPTEYADAYDSPQRLRPPLPPLAHLPYAAAATAALAIAAFVSTKAIAAVVLPLQLVVAWAVLDLAGFASRRTAVLAALPGIAGVLATFKFQPDDAALPVAAGLGAGFVLIAADAVFRARRRGVEPGSVRSLAAAVSALLFAGLTGLFLPAAALHSSSVAAGAAVCGLASLLAARNPELGASRAAVVAIPVTIAALASYAAAILVP